MTVFLFVTYYMYVIILILYVVGAVFSVLPAKRSTD